MKFEAAAAANNQSDGDMGWFRKGDLREELEKAVELKKNGEITDVICTDIGFHIIKKTGEEASG
jgi:parvulin-like peptidyl-prolyl isomerase